jgi:phosphoglycerol transferase MdoB-like AlkP superfamily enzyme
MLSRLKEKFFAFSLVILRLSTILFLLTFLFRLSELIILAIRTTLPQEAWLNLLLGVAGDVAAICYYAVILFLPVFLVFLVSETISKLLLKVVFAVLVILQLLLTIYFLISGILLDDAFYNYTYADIKYILESTGIALTLLSFCIVVLFLLFYFLLAKFSSKTFAPTKKYALFLPAAILIAALHQNIMHLSINGDFGISIQVNKSFYFFNRTIKYFSNSTNHIKQEDLNREITLFQRFHGDTNYVSTKYPLLNKNIFPDVLSPFFNVQSSKIPNLVFIIVEGLSRSFSGKDATDGSCTPFLDSLAEHSLYFPNTLSTCERTLGVLPSLLGSLPYGRGGFTKLIEDGSYPHHFSLLKILKENDFFTSFHYGGWTHFTNYDDFLFEEGIDFISNEGSRAENSSWGLSDDELYKSSIRVFDSLDISQPRVDIYLTLSTHHPFQIPNSDYYQKLFLQRLLNSSLEQSRKEELKKYLDNYASVLYADDAIRHFFQGYPTWPEYNNTIFIITGDHAMPEIPLAKRYISRYHVPLLIYSPLLRSAKTFPAVSSHLDITPSLLSFLSKNYNLKTPEKVHWLGDGLDTSSVFRNIHDIAFMYNNTEIADYISGNYFLNGHKAYDISKGLDSAIEITDQSAIAELKNRLHNFRVINSYVCSSDKIIDAGSVDSFFNHKKEILLPVNTSFSFTDSGDTAVIVLDKFELKDLHSAISIQYDFIYKSFSSNPDNPALCFSLFENKGKEINHSEQKFNPEDKSKGGLPVSGFYHFDFKTQSSEKKFLTIYFKKSPTAQGQINHLHIKAKGN